MSNQETKRQLIRALYDRDVWIQKVNEVQYRTRCPFCGDSMKNENTGHLYIKIDVNDNYPVVYHCFRCEESGILKSDILELLDIDNASLKSSMTTLNKTSDKLDVKNINQGNNSVFFDYQLPPIQFGGKTDYINKRLGLNFTEDDFTKMKVITSLFAFLRLNKITSVPFAMNLLERFEDHYVGFLSYGNSHILLRDITNTEKISWVKYPICPESRENRLFYIMSGEIDLFTQDTITVNISEGVMDILSVNYNLGFNKSNTMNIAVTGKYYNKIILFLIDKGIIGGNIIINIFADNDEHFGKHKDRKLKDYYSTTLPYYKKLFENYKYLFKEVNLYYNNIGKDVGVPREQISLIDYKL